MRAISVAERPRSGPMARRESRSSVPSMMLMGRISIPGLEAISLVRNGSPETSVHERMTRQIATRDRASAFIR